MTEARLSYPRPEDVVGMSAALSLVLSWFSLARFPVADESSAAATLGDVARGTASPTALLRAGEAIGMLPAMSPSASAAYAGLRFALTVAVNATLGQRVSRAVFVQWESTFFGHLATAAAHLAAAAGSAAVSSAVVSAEHQLRVVAGSAAASLSSSTTDAKRRPTASAYHRCVGMIVEHLRVASGQTRMGLAAMISASGRAVSPDTLRRVEAGTAGDHHAARRAVEACGRSWEWTVTCADASMRLGQQFARLACGAEGDVWFDETARAFGEKVALSTLRLAVVATLRRESA